MVRSPAAAGIAAGFVGGAVREFQASALNTNTKNQVGQAYINWLHANGGAQSNKAAETVGEAFGELEAAVGRAMGVHINSIREQVESIIAEKEKGQDEADRLAKELAAVSERLDEIEGKLDELIDRVKLA